MATSGVPSAPASLARPRSGRGFAHLAAAQQSAGVTLVELAVIMAIVAVIAGVTAPVFAGYVQRANIATAIGDIKRLEVQIERFRSDTGGLPDHDEQEDEPAFQRADQRAVVVAFDRETVVSGQKLAAVLIGAAGGYISRKLNIAIDWK